jgi:hypothetical protein
MSKKTQRVTSKAAKTAKSTARKAASTSRKAAKVTARKATSRASKAAAVTLNRKGGYAVGKKRAAVPKPTAAIQPRPQAKKPRPLTPVEQAAHEGLTYHGADGDDVLIADDADVQRIAKAITEHRKDLMKNLAR